MSINLPVVPEETWHSVHCLMSGGHSMYQQKPMSREKPSAASSLQSPHASASGQWGMRCAIGAAFCTRGHSSAFLMNVSSSCIVLLIKYILVVVCIAQATFACAKVDIISSADEAGWAFISFR